ncbi:hypothetical protein ACIGXM_08810, partial [Kitasatospora sp. NPDC052896]
MRERSSAPRHRLSTTTGRLAAIAALTTIAAGLAGPAYADGRGPAPTNSGTATTAQAAPAAARPSTSSVLGGGSNTQLAAGASMSSGCAQLTLQSSGNLVLTELKTGKVLFTTNVQATNGAGFLNVSTAGLTLFDGSGRLVWQAGPSAEGGNATLTVQDDCNLVLRNGSGTPVWSTRSYNAKYDTTGQVVTAGTTLQSGTTVTAAQTKLSMQPDGNLVLYSLRSGLPLWSSGTYNHPGAYAFAQRDGNFVIYGADGTALWSTWSWGNPGSHLTVQNDSNVVLYNADDKPVWNSGTYYANPALLGTAITSGSTVQSGAAVAW